MAVKKMVVRILKTLASTFYSFYANYTSLTFFMGNTIGEEDSVSLR